MDIVDDRTFVRRTLILLMLAAMAAGLVLAAKTVLLLFGATLFAVVLRGMGRQLQRLAPLPDTLAIMLVLLAMVLLAVGFMILLGQQVSAQFSSLAERLPDSINQLEESLRRTGWGQRLLDGLGGGSGSGASSGGLSTPSNVGQQVGQMLSIAGTAVLRIVGALGDLLLVLIGGIYLALQPGLYRVGVEKLVPKDRTDQIHRTLDRSGQALWAWSIGQLTEMLAVGLLTTLGLWALGVPSPLALGILAALLEFIPIIGPILAAAPAVLLSLTQGAQAALYTAAFYAVLQQVEGNLIMPVIQRQAVALPPVVTLFALLVFGALFGTIGVILATPLAVLLMVWVQTLYVQETLGKPVRVEGTGA